MDAVEPERVSAAAAAPSFTGGILLATVLPGLGGQFRRVRASGRGARGARWRSGCLWRVAALDYLCS